MLIFDQLKKNDTQLRLLAAVVFGGMLVLLAGLWWVQVVLARDYQEKLETQSFRTVRVPAVRGKILDRNGVALADNLPRFSASLYLEELRRAFDAAYKKESESVKARAASEEKKLGRKLTSRERTQFGLMPPEKRRVRYQVASNIVAQLGEGLRQPVVLEEAKFQQHYTQSLVLPYPVIVNLDATNLARFEEQSVSMEGLDLEVQPLRYYPYRTTAAHLLGQMRRDTSSAEGEDAFFNYPLPVYRGTVGVEAAFDSQLRGRAGSKSVLVNNLGYRQSASIWTPAEAGDNVVLTIDLAIQQAAERALQRAGANARAAAVVLDSRNADILAMASSPTYDPNAFIPSVSRAEWEKLNDKNLTPQKNRAIQKNYAPGSIFKLVVSLALLENGLNPAATYTVQPDPARPGRGCIYVLKRKIEDTAPPGDYDFHRALLRSSNAYFISNGLHVGMENILRVAKRLHLGERCGIPTWQEVPGNFPSTNRVRAGWSSGDTANICIGQGLVDVTPLQMAVLTAAIASDGKVFTPRLVERIEPQDPLLDETKEAFPQGRVRDQLGVSPRSLQILREAMLADTEDSEGTAYDAFHQSGFGAKGFRVCGKTGTAQVMNERNEIIDHTTWFVSFAPYESPRYVVVVMVESGGSGGRTCAPIARDIYAALEQQERNAKAKNNLAQVQ